MLATSQVNASKIAEDVTHRYKAYKFLAPIPQLHVGKPLSGDAAVSVQYPLEGDYSGSLASSLGLFGRSHHGALSVHIADMQQVNGKAT